MKKILEFLSENFQFLVVKFPVYLNRRVFIMLWIKFFNLTIDMTSVSNCMKIRLSNTNCRMSER